MPVDCSGENDALDVRADALQIVCRHALPDAHHVLLDDRAFIEILGRVVRCRADQLDPSLTRLDVGVRSHERRQERVMDVDDGAADVLEKLAGQDLHVAGEHDEVDVAREHFQHLLLGLRFAPVLDRDVVVGGAELLDLTSEIGVVRDDGEQVELEVVASPAPEQVEQAVLAPRNENRDAFAFAREDEPRVHREPLDDRGQLRTHPFSIAIESGEMELHSQEERSAFGIGRVLVGADDVRAEYGQLTGECGDDPLPVSTRDDEACSVGLKHEGNRGALRLVAVRMLWSLLYTIRASMSPSCECRYELLPFRRGEEQAAEVAPPLRLTVTSSPKHGIDRSIDYAERLCALGHRVTVHLAARMVRNREHLDAILARTTETGVDDVFVIGGDLPEPIGPYSSAGELLDVLGDHPQRPVAIGVAAYPEGHPLIGDRQLQTALEHKARLATYMVTQICYDANVLLAWLSRLRASGIALPLYAGATGQVDRRRLLEMSVRVGVGPSLRFLRTQRGIGRLLRGSTDAGQRFYEAIDAERADPRLGIVGFHFFTFNELVATWRWQQAQCPNGDRPAIDALV